MTEKGKKQGQYKVDSEVRNKFGAAVRFTGMTTNEAIEEAMRLFTDKHIRGVDKK